jgi:hypothetical protein
MHYVHVVRRRPITKEIVQRFLCRSRPYMLMIIISSKDHGNRSIWVQNDTVLPLNKSMKFNYIQMWPDKGWGTRTL